jgi:hypothetical protein
MSGLQPVIPFSAGRRPVNVAGTALSDVKQSYLLNPTPPTPRAAALASTAAAASSVPSASAAFASASASAENDPAFANRSSATPRSTGAAASTLPSPDRTSSSSAAPNQTADGLFEISAERLASIRAQVQRGAREAGERFRIHVHTQTEATDPTFVETLQRKVDLLEQVWPIRT